MARTKKQNKIAVGGNVKISAYKGKRKIKQISVKNNATYNLFNFLLECLKGDLKQNNRPTYLKVLAVKTTEDFDSVTPSIAATVKLNSVVVDLSTEGAQEEGRAINKFFMLYSAFTSGGNTSSVYSKIFTLQDSSSNTLAEVELTKQTTLEIDPKQMNYSLLIDWSIGFKNPDPIVKEPEAIQQ